MRLTLSLLPLALLAACGDGGEATDDGRSATGQVLEGSISDDMLPLATVRSQAPLLPPEEQDPDDDDEPAAPGDTPSPAATAQEGAEPAPSPEPTQTPAPAPAS